LFYAEGGKSSIQAPAWLAKMGLTAYEVNFGRGIKMGDKMAEELGVQARAHNISVSFHTPYYINLAADPAEVQKSYAEGARFVSGANGSYAYIEKCLRIAKVVNASDGPLRLVIHVGSQCDLSRETAIENCKKNLLWVTKQLEKNKFDNFLLCIETMGRYKAIGTYREICEICKIDSRIIPTIDFGHINCIEQGALQRRDSDRMREIVEYCINEIGLEKMKRVHIHFSAVEYTVKGEHAHSTLDNPAWAFPFEPLARIIKEKNLSPIIICESQGNMAQDAKKLADIWREFS